MGVGSNQYGQLGDDTKTDQLSPKLVRSGYASMAAGDKHGVGIKSDGSLWVWGSNSTSQLGQTVSESCSGMHCSTQPLLVFPDGFTIGSSGGVAGGADCLFDWAELHYATLLAPAGATSATYGSYYYRRYPATNAYLATSAADGHVYYLGALSNGAIMSIGALSEWLITAGCGN